MWILLTILIFVAEAMLLANFILEKIKKKKLNKTALSITFVFCINYSLHLIPFLYEFFVLKENTDFILGLINCLGPAIKLFVGEPNVEQIAVFSSHFPIFSYAYLFGSIIAIFTTIATAFEAFKDTMINNLRLTKALKGENCDIVVGNNPNALYYTKSCNAVLLLDNSVSKETVKELIENGYKVIHKNFTAKLLQGHLFNSTTRYNIICSNEEKTLNYLDEFISYKKSEQIAKNIHLYVEIEGARAENIRREIIEKNGMGAYVNTFCTKEITAKTFIEENPITKFLPTEYLQNASIKPNTEINIFLLGFDALSNEIYRHSIINNQLVTFDGEYKVLPINYYLCDKDIETSAWNITGLKKSLEALNAEKYFPLPELPFNTNVLDLPPHSPEISNIIKEKTKRSNSYTLVIINTQNDCVNIELGSKLKSKLFDESNYHILVRSEANYTENTPEITYFGTNESVFNHNVIVNDSLSFIAKTLNEVYNIQSATEEQKALPDFDQYIKQKSEDFWNNLSCFLLQSNLYSAMNLRVKLNLLGLDYKRDGKGERLSLIGERYGHKGEYAYSEYFNQSVRNAIIAQEHARWNAYHFLNEFMPLKKDDISVNRLNTKQVAFNIKIPEAKLHACLTTHSGLNALSSYLAEKANNGSTAADYDYYIYDEALIISAESLLAKLGFSVTEKK